MLTSSSTRGLACPPVLPSEKRPPVILTSFTERSMGVFDAASGAGAVGVAADLRAAQLGEVPIAVGGLDQGDGGLIDSQTGDVELRAKRSAARVRPRWRAIWPARRACGCRPDRRRWRDRWR